VLKQGKGSKWKKAEGRVVWGALEKGVAPLALLGCRHRLRCYRARKGTAGASEWLLVLSSVGRDSQVSEVRVYATQRE